MQHPDFNGAFPKHARNTSAAGASAVVTLAAVANEFHTISDILVSLSAAPAAVVTITITDGGTTILLQRLWEAAVATGLSKSINMTLPIRGSRNSAVVITVAGAGGTAVTELDVNYQ